MRVKLVELAGLVRERRAQDTDLVADALGTLLLLLQRAHVGLVDARILRALLAQRADRVQRLGVARDFEYIVKALLERGRLGQGPVRLLLMAK